jgi:hypothetical protein
MAMQFILVENPSSIYITLTSLSVTASAVAAPAEKVLDRLMVLPELGAVALVEDEDHALFERTAGNLLSFDARKRNVGMEAFAGLFLALRGIGIYYYSLRDKKRRNPSVITKGIMGEWVSAW